MITKLIEFYSDEGNERVGFILKSGEIVEVDNVHPEPDQGFDVRAEDLIRYENEILATWHTHPKYSSNLSTDDYVTFLSWSHISHYVIGSDGVRCFKVDNNIVFEDEEAGSISRVS